MSASGQRSPEAKRFAKWLANGMSGCEFARRMSPEGKETTLSFSTVYGFEQDHLAPLQHFFDDAADRGSVALLLFPELRTHLDVAEACRVLSLDPRWRTTRQSYSCAVTGCEGLRLDWTTKAGLRSTAMGFAPFGEMPLTRRSPHVAIALWTGDRRNQFHTGGRPGTVSMAHAPHPWSVEKHQEHWEKTVEAVKAMCASPAENTRELRDITFCLRADAVAHVVGA